jgi:alkylation response protein AidB-like acyl-CoA dehydrogenase
MKRCAELNLTGILFPEKYGGLGLGLTEFCLALEEISRASQTMAITLDASVTLCFLPILTSGTEEQREKYIRRSISGELIGAISMTEPCGTSNFPAHTATAVRDGNHWILNGTKVFTTNSQAADVYLFFCRVDGNPMPSCFIVEKGMPGLSFGKIEKKLGWHGSNTGTVHYDDVRVPAANLLGNLHEGLPAVGLAISESCVGIGAMCVGAAAGVFQKTLEYARDRNLLGRQMIDIQGVYESLARMAMDIETSRSLVYRAAGLIDSGQPPLLDTPSGFFASACKTQPPEMAAQVCDMAIQLHGGHGYMDDMGIHRYWRDVRACQIGEGPTYGHLERMIASVRKQNFI